MVPLDLELWGDGATAGDAGELPVAAAPRQRPLDLVEWARENRDEIESLTASAGAVLLRGFEELSLPRLADLVEVFSSRPVDYRYGHGPRGRIHRYIYNSTDVAAERVIPLHNELSYARMWPLRVWFMCIDAPQSGGETPIADSRRVLARIPPAVVEAFEANRVMYVRNYGETHGEDVSWKQAFETESRSDVEEFCRRFDIGFEWLEDGRLRTRQVCQATAVHPVTGEHVWFNQAHLFHSSTMERPLRLALLARFGSEGLPRNAFFGDGSPIPASMIGEIRDAYRQSEVRFSWAPNDVFMVDNMLVAHGRTPFSGSRRVAVAMAEPIEQQVTSG